MTQGSEKTTYVSYVHLQQHRWGLCSSGMLRHITGYQVSGILRQCSGSIFTCQNAQAASHTRRKRRPQKVLTSQMQLKIPTTSANYYMVG